MLVKGTLDQNIVAVSMNFHGVLSESRNNLISLAQTHAPTHLFFVDSDMVLPPDILARLLRHQKPIVSGLYYQRQFPHVPVYKKDVPPPLPAKLPMDFLEKLPPEGTELMEVGVIGFGCVLVEWSLLMKIAEKVGTPTRFFAFENNEGEDMHFCRHVHNVGEKIWLDPTAECGHVATHVVTRETCLAASSGQTATSRLSYKEITGAVGKDETENKDSTAPSQK